jgi:hypothetical protein
MMSVCAADAAPELAAFQARVKELAGRLLLAPCARSFVTHMGRVPLGAAVQPFRRTPEEVDAARWSALARTTAAACRDNATDYTLARAEESMIWALQFAGDANLPAAQGMLTLCAARLDKWQTATAGLARA